MKSVLRKQATVGYSLTYVILLLILLQSFQPAIAQNGFLYIHTKAISEDLHQAFSFTVKKSTTTISTFSLRDELLNIEPTDIGAGHGTGAGELWIVAGASRGAEGLIYRRSPGTNTWVQTGTQNAAAIDGADLNHFVMADAAGNAYVYNGTSFKKILDQGSSGIKAIDISSNGSITSATGITVIVDANGKVWKYTGDYSNTRTWKDITPTNSSGGTFNHADINPVTNSIVLSDNVNAVTRTNANGGSVTYLGKPSGSVASATDIAVDDDGVIYCISKDGNGMDAVYRNTGSVTAGWTEEPHTGLHYNLTAGDASQVWVIKGFTAAQASSFANPSTIYTRTGDGSATWLDDERVQTTQEGNSIMIPVAAGTYSIAETAVSGWKLQKIDVYDSAAGSSTNVAGNSATIVVAAGQVAHVVFTNGMILPNTMSAQPGSSIVLADFGSGATGTKGAALSGLTDFHYFTNTAMNTTPDGYYSLTQNSSGWENSSLTDHTGKTGGYFMMINASYAPNVFYRQRVKGLVPGNLYILSFWSANLSPSSPLQPNILAGVSDTATGLTFLTLSTGTLSNDRAWHQHIFSFTALSTSSDIFLQNFALGGFGNDLAIDDIRMSAASSLLAITDPGLAVVKTTAGVQLTWTGQPGEGLDYFQVQQSTNGTNWKTLDKIAAIESSTAQSYSYMDGYPAAGISYYRLVMTEKGGTMSYSGIKTISYSAASNFAASPNPFSNNLQLQWQQAKQGMATINVLNAGGQPVFSQSLQLSAGMQSIAINAVSALPKGMYFLQVVSNGNSFSKTILKQ